MQNIYSHLTLWYLHRLSRDCVRSDLMTTQAHSILLLYKLTSDVLGNSVWEQTLAVPLPRALNQHARAQSSFPASQAGHTEPGSLVQSTLQWCWTVGQITVFTKLVLFCLFLWPRCMACGILVSQPRTESRPMAVKALSPNHWTAKDSQAVCFNFWSGWLWIVGVPKMILQSIYILSVDS